MVMAAIPDYESEYVYFLYSDSQYKMRTEVESNLNKRFIPGEVMVRGDWKKFTQISKISSSAMFADSVVVAEGYKDKMKYKDCTSQWKL